LQLGEPVQDGFCLSVPGFCLNRDLGDYWIPWIRVLTKRFVNMESWWLWRRSWRHDRRGRISNGSVNLQAAFKNPV